MRILFLHHFPLPVGAAGRLAQQWALALESAGHEARMLIVDANREQADAVVTRRVVCQPGDEQADMPFDMPYFSSAATAGQATFAALSDPQLNEYREQLRRHLDREIDGFDPHLIHGQHIWVQGQLALESGVPYVLNAWGEELDEYTADPRYRALADQAAENAGRILVPNDGVLKRVTKMFELAADRTRVMPAELTLSSASPTPAEQAAASDSLVAIYQAVLAERFGGER